jgi:hypothetical protein
MVTRGAKEYPKAIPSETQGGRPLYFLRVLSCCTLLEYGTTWVYIYDSGMRPEHFRRRGKAGDGRAAEPAASPRNLPPRSLRRLRARTPSIAARPPK